MFSGHTTIVGLVIVLRRWHFVNVGLVPNVKLTLSFHAIKLSRMTPGSITYFGENTKPCQDDGGAQSEQFLLVNASSAQPSLAIRADWPSTAQRGLLEASAIKIHEGEAKCSGAARRISPVSKSS